MYSIDTDAPRSKRDRARQLITESIESRSGIVSFQVIHEFINVLTRKMNPRLDTSTIRMYLQTAPFQLTVMQPSISVVEQALELFDARQISWYDALIVSSALDGDCSILYTEDLQDGMKFGRLKIVNPFRVH